MLDSSNVLIMKFMIVSLATIFFGVLGGKKDHAKCSCNYYRFSVFNFIL